jgi:hypothetical protein
MGTSRCMRGAMDKEIIAEGKLVIQIDTRLMF